MRNKRGGSYTQSRIIKSLSMRSRVEKSIGWFRLIEFFESDEGRMSMSRLLMFMSFFPATYVLIKTLDIEALWAILSAFCGVYGVGKVADRKKRVIRR